MIINFMTFNIQSCHNYYTREIDIPLMVDTIKKCQGEIIGLNEVYGGGVPEPAQAAAIARELGYYCYFGPAIIHKGRPFGNALISKYPWTQIETIPIPDPVRNTDEYYESRTIIKASFNNPDFTVLISHFGLAKSEQINAVGTAVNLINEITTPLILMGDFNIEPEDEKLKPFFTLLKNTYNKEIPSFPSGEPKRRIDYIFVSSDIEVMSAAIVPVVASDHLPHTATLKIPK
ncbi:MAG: endonuclease/exonuclease/phosphatase family protein [Bacilli bacterium]|nr:endonuclease/exonuclease/phosphatase family protein [Bacilli bacterium]